MSVIFRPEDYATAEVMVEHIGYSLFSGRPFSLIRLGDGELMVLAQEFVYSLDWIEKNVPWRGSNTYCGVKLPNLELRDRMIESITKADMVGVFADDDFTCQVFRALGIQPRSICYAFENVYLPMFKPFVDLIRRYPPLLVGRPAEQFARFLYEKLGVVVPGTVSIDGYEEIDSCIEAMARIGHEWSLVSAGCNATVICTTMAEQWGKVAIDFGHAPDNAMSPDYPDYWLNTD
ncbi:MAG: GT-D fold domain-containing glycosyltransferase [Bacillota bacterium]